MIAHDMILTLFRMLLIQIRLKSRKSQILSIHLIAFLINLLTTGSV